MSPSKLLPLRLCAQHCQQTHEEMTAEIQALLQDPYQVEHWLSVLQIETQTREPGILEYLSTTVHGCNL